MAKQQQMNTKNGNVNETENLLPIREASQLLHVHANTVRRWAAQGLLREYRVGPANHRRFKLGDITALLNEQS